MSYLGNPSISPDVQERIMGVFAHALEDGAAGNRDECLLGCDFILQMDPLFTPAQTLLERVKASGGPVPVHDLRARLEAPSEVPEDLDEDDDLDLEELPELPEIPDSLPREELVAAFQERRYRDVLGLAEAHRDAVMADDELREIATSASSRLEAEPYISNFVSSARSAMEDGSYDEALRLLDKAKSLDSSHPSIGEVAELIARASAPTPPVAEAAPDLEADLGDFEPLELEELSFEEPDLEELPSSDEAAPAAATDEEEFAGETDPRILELLREGKGHYDAADFQAAIDAWSRIFLIDIDHQEANRWIEEARSRKAEKERLVEELFHEAMELAEAGSLDEAQSVLQRVLERQPNHVQAQEYLERIEAGEPFQGEADLDAAMASFVETGDDADLKQEILIPPDDAEPTELPQGIPADLVAPKPKPSRNFAVIGGVALVVVVAVVWFLVSGRETFFPNAAEAPIATIESQPSAIERATKLHDEGKSALAIAQLRRLPPNHEEYEAAQSLVAQWEAAEDTGPVEPTPEEIARRESLVAKAREHAAAREFLPVGPLLQEASQIVELDAEEIALQREAQSAVAALSPFITLIRDQEPETALPDLWKLYDADRGNRDVERLIIAAYYNLGVRSLQRGDTRQAQEMFGEASALAPQDQALTRLEEFSSAYAGRRSEDLLFRIFVKYLPFRQV